jgi:hypothetical protein
MSMLFKPQKLDILLKRIHHRLSSASTIRYRRAEVLAKVLLSIDIFIFKPNFYQQLLRPTYYSGKRAFFRVIESVPYVIFDQYSANVFFLFIYFLFIFDFLIVGRKFS